MSPAEGPGPGVEPAAQPVVRWTPPEAWLQTELTRRALMMKINGGSARRLGGEGCFFEAKHDAEGPALELRFRARRVELWLEPQDISGHRWREGWALELEPLEERRERQERVEEASEGGEPEADGEAEGEGENVAEGDDGAIDERAPWPGPRQPLQIGGAPFEREAPKARTLLGRLRRSEIKVRVRMRSLRWTVTHPLAARDDGGELEERVVLQDVAFHKYTRQSTAMVSETEAWMAPTLPEPAPWWELPPELT